MLVMLAGGSSPAWADTFWDKTNTDKGGGTYRFKGESYNILFNSADAYANFETVKRFDIGNDQFYFDFAMRVYFFSNASQEAFVENFAFDGEIYVVTDDDVSHKIATWTKKRAEATTISYSTTDDRWGTITTSQIHGYANLSVFYAPSGRAFEDGVKRIIMKQLIAVTYPGYYATAAKIQYEKDLDLSGIATDKPMPKPTVEWGTDGKLAFKATGVPDKRNNSKIGSQGYVVDLYYYENGQKSDKGNGYTTGMNNMTYSNVRDGKMDVSFSHWQLTSQTQYANAAYTVPVYVDYYAYMRLNKDGNIVPDRHVIAQPMVEGVLVKPFTRPVTVSTDFDKWNKKTLVKWTRQTSAKGFNGREVVSVDCRYEGKWHVLRYEKAKGAGTYKEIGTVDGNQTKLEVTDTDFDYDREYTYRVVFLPTILETAYGTKMHQLPGYAGSHTDYDLWEEATVSTELGVHITLTQDRDYTEKVRLKWQYSIAAKGLTWYIEYKPTGGTTWLERTETIPVDVNQTEATADFSGSVCEAVTYRIKTRISGQDVYSDTLSTRLSSGSYIRKMTATTGTEQSVVKVEWDVENADPTNKIKYLVKRRPVGTEEWTTVSDSISDTKEHYEWTDTRPQTGTYYEYTVEAYGAVCPEQVEQAKMDGLVTPGFSQARGTITGHIAFGSGTAVQGARVNLIKSTADQESDQVQYLSRYIEGAGKGLVWQADPSKYDKLLCGSQPATLQLWAKPASEGSDQMALATLNGALQVGVKRVGGSYRLYALDMSSGNAATYKETEFANLPFSEHDFTHVAATYDAGKWKFYVGTDSLLTDSITVVNANWKAAAVAGKNTLAIGGSEQAVHSAYKGHVDDIRLWTRALDDSELASSYTRILGGTEDGLALYWPLDEGELVRQYAFDIACQGGMYQLNHPQVGPNAVPRKEVPSLLKLYGVTDKEGDYIIKGIPFQQGGTNYKVAPELGVHSFSPATRSMYVSPTSLTANNIDFEDVSSFPMEGYVYYAGTNIPAEGIMIKVDGQPQSVDGELVKTGTDGHYQLSVPIGDHYVEAYLDNHTMVDGGRYPLKNKATFIEPVRYDFYDATTVNLIGRIAGGERSDTLGVGFGNNERIVGGPSKNNIGTATITLKLNNDSRSFNRVEGKPTESAMTRRVWESDTTSVRSYSWTGVNHTDSVYKDNYIYIKTDPETGEFSAKIPPLKYTVKSIVVESNKENIEFTELPELDMTVAGGSHTDSVRVLKEGSQDTTWVKYKYHTKLVRTYYAQPQLSIVENGHKAGFFGLEKITYKGQAEGEEDVTIDGLYTEKDGKPEYLVGYPIYQTGNQVKYHLRGFEVYENLDDTKNVKCDTINLPHAMITVANEMSDEQKIVYKVMDESTGYKAGQVYELQTKQMPLDDNGEADLTWTAGLPNITDPYTRKFSIALERKNRTYNVDNLDAVVLGELTNGSNFVTQGPDIVNFVLRDPQGAKSTTKLTVGTTTTNTTYDTRRAYGEYKAVFSTHIGTKNEIGTGVGLVVMSELSSKGEVDVGAHTTWEKTWNRDSTHVETTVENVATSSSKPYVGAQGDVYIGKSHNWLVGGCRRLFIDWSEEKKKYELKLEEALAFGDTITTAFKFTQYELENVMIPKWKDMRRSFLTEVATEAEARSYVNNGTSPVYLTWKGLEEKDYTEGKNYVWVKPESWKTKLPSKIPEDSVNWCNNQIKLWEQTIRDNEADKVRLMKQGKKQNISIDGGSSYSYSKRTSNTKHDETTINWKMGAILGGGFGFQNVTFVDIGHNISITTENGGGYTKGDGTITENFSEWDYTIEDGNRDTDLSLTIYESDNPKYSDFFSVFGGQTYNPYQEQEWTHYYKDDAGNYVALGNSTVQMEQPDLRIGLPGENSAKSVTVTDIPAGGEANVTLYCTNLANAHQGVNFSYDILVLDETNKNGLQILMDGVPVNGRSVYLEHSETTTKVLTIRQTDQSVMDFEGIKFWLASQYQPAKIHDEVTLNAHFSPSSSPVVLAIQEPVLNSNTPGGELEMRVKDFNRQFTNLKNVGVQYRFAGNTQWTDLYTWWVNPKDTVRLDALKNTLLPASGSLYYKLNMTSDLSYPEGNYEFRAFTTTPYGNELVHVYSDVVNVIKDRTRPTNLFTPAPANGILGYGDQLAIEFNEDIVPGYVGADNVIVTARLNQDKVAHDVALSLMPYGDTPRTVNPVFLNGDFSLEFWMKWEEGGTILHHGAKTDNFALAIGNDGYVTATIAKTQFRSKNPLPKNQWTFVALTYKSSEKTFNGKAVYGEENALLFSDEKVPNQALQAVTAASDNYLYLGDVRADMHSLALYNIHRDMNLAIAEKDVVKDNYVYGLANYWPMDEGHGFVAADKRHTHDFTVPDRWVLANVNYALRIDQPEGVAVDITQATTGRGDSYAVELWYNRNGVTDEAVFETASPDATGDSQKDYNKLKLYYNADKDLVLQYGEKQQTVASHEDFDLNSAWHHYALNVVRGQSASFYLDGQRTAVIAEADVPPLEGTRLVMGQKATLAWVDELRIWHASLSEKRIQQNIYNALDTADIYCRGLVAYYPLEKQGKENGVDTKVFAAENLAPAATLHKNDKGEMVSDSLIVVGVEQPDWKIIGSTFSPALKNAPNEKLLTVTPVASERKVVLNLTGATVTARQLEGTTLNITVDNVRDLHGNTSLPIRWTAYVQQNTLKWMKDSVNVFKKYGDDYTFDVEIENQSGNTEYYTLYNMPQWLSLVDSERSDDVSPLRTKTLRFRVNPLTPVGNYDLNIGLQGNNGIQEPMRIVMKVRGEKPNWTVDPTKYQHQMNIIGQVYIGGILMENAESMVAAFIGNECRGVASPEKVRGAAYVTMNVYGDDTETDDMGKAVTFRIWDASRGVAYTDANIAVPMKTAANADSTVTEVIFGQDKMLGSFDKPAIWTKSDNVEQLIPIHQNWNWIAFGVEPQSTYLNHVFGTYAEWGMLIKNRDNWNDYNGAEWGFGTLKRAKANEMYKLKIDRLPTTKQEAPNSQLAVSGRQLKEKKERAVTLTTGWNWIAYTPLTTMTVDEALAAANPQKGDIVKSQTGVAIYGNYGWEGSLKALESGRGYLYYSNSNDTTSFLYPTETAASARMAAPRRALEELRIFTPVALGLYPSNMTMAIQLIAVDGSPVDTCEVAAFVGDECRGATRASDNGLYYLVISGEGAGQPMMLRTCIDGEIIDIDNTQKYVSDANIGTSWEPYVIDLSDVLSAITVVSGSPADGDDWYTLSGIKLDRKPTQPGVYIHHGEKIIIKEKK